MSLELIAYITIIATLEIAITGLLLWSWLKRNMIVVKNNELEDYNEINGK
jgi:hypothetical protein